MRLKINFSPNTIPVPINNHHILNSFIHGCLGVNNKYHDAPSDYNISHILGGKLNEDRCTLNFINGSFILVSSFDEDFIDLLLLGILKSKHLFGGMKFSGVEYITEEFYDGWNYFATLSPFIIKDKIDSSFLTLDNIDFESKINQFFINKLSAIDKKLDLRNFKVIIPPNKSKIKKITVKNVSNLANQCQLNIYTNKKVAELLWTLGIGQSTGSGFGTICKTSEFNTYR